MIEMSQSNATSAKLTIRFKEEGDIISHTENITSLCAENREPHENHLQVSKSPSPLQNKTDAAQRNSKNSHISLISSVTNIAAEVFTAKKFTIGPKCGILTTLAVIICLMIVIFLVPIIWYNTNPPSEEKYVTEKTIFYNLDIDDCTVSKLVLTIGVCTFMCLFV